MKKVTKQSLDELAKLMNVLSREEQFGFLGRNACVLSCYADLSYHSAVSWWVNNVIWDFGYNVYENGGLSTSDITAVGGMGGLSVTDVSNTIFSLNNGETLMLTFFGGSVDHAVIVTSVETIVENGDPISIFHYRDPSDENKPGVTRSFSGLYTISRVY